jgi:sialic acid synthase SpsE
MAANRMTTIPLSNKTIGDDYPCFIIAEAGLNHNGDPNLAHQLIDSAAKCGADAIKFQTYKTEELFPPDHPDYQKFQQTEFTLETYKELKSHTEEKNLVFLSTPFDVESLEMLEALHVEAIKIGSGEVTHLAFLNRVTQSNKPVILSTGMSTVPEIQAAVQKLVGNNCCELALLHCVSAYPCPADKANIRMVSFLKKHFNLLTGYSDHTTSDTAAMSAVALGACIIEKHFTLDHELPGWDHFFSYDPNQFKSMVKSIRETEAVLGLGDKVVADVEEEIHKIARRSIYARRDIKAGETIEEHMLVIRRPVGPLQADQIDAVIGKQAANNISAESPLRLDMLE